MRKKHLPPKRLATPQCVLLKGRFGLLELYTHELIKVMDFSL